MVNYNHTLILHVYGYIKPQRFWRWPWWPSGVTCSLWARPDNVAT